jgi:hypothetical protein
VGEKFFFPHRGKVGKGVIKNTIKHFIVTDSNIKL